MAAETIQIRRGTAADWTAAAPTLAAGEWAMETDTGLLKIGDGTTVWASLPYVHAHAVDAASITAGTLATARLGSGTADATTVLAGDQAWKNPNVIPREINAQTGTTYTIAASDVGKLVTCTNAAAITVTLPQDSAATFAVGASVDIAGLGAGLVTFAAGTGATMNPTSAATRAQYSVASAIKRAANTWLVVGDLA